ncbi:hypothetical protein QBC35DRAFT_545071 [Podospora australis]|uniref:ubiquitinyl hydrolase 1 n=1 Tax=Podospora australis TaxID=1536484 RepID=A0AAN6WMI6_9PEZI|nr:hypothetical protein QBC35DRAFT_545071 [Podospora australis]
MEKSLFHHLALPPCLPQREDTAIDDVEAELIDRLIIGAQLMRDALSDHRDNPLSSTCQSAWESVRLFLATSKAVNHGGRVIRTELLPELRLIAATATNALILHIRNQNAALLIHRFCDIPDHVVFEVFETSPKNEDVLATGNALGWDFPGTAVAIPLTTFRNEDFLVSLATFIEQASIETTKRFAAYTYKAGADIHEYRDTGSPALVSSLLMAILEENGRRISTPRLSKRVRDDICWKNTKRPWRRLPLYLVLRVAIARYLGHALGPELARFNYKFFICICLSTFMESSQPLLDLDQADYLKAKICRRLVKLDVDKARSEDQSSTSIIDTLFEQLSPRVQLAIHVVAQRMQYEWTSFKIEALKPIPTLPRRAAPVDLQLQLRESGQTLRRLQASSAAMIAGRQRWVRPSNFDLGAIADGHLSEFANQYFSIAREEKQLTESRSGIVAQTEQYLVRAMSLYQGNPGQMSLLILNVMEQWMIMDQLTCATFPLLRKYHPVFAPSTLDVLHLASYSDLVRLQTVQNYLHVRIQNSNDEKTSVFADPSSDCFAARYYDEGFDNGEMAGLYEEIRLADAARRERKMQEWREKTALFESLTRQVDTSSCISITDENSENQQGNLRGFHNKRLCPRCQAMIKLERMRITIYEESLPTNEALLKAVLFELLCPASFLEYRDTTWMIISKLGSCTEATGVLPKSLLRQYTQLSPFVRHKESSFTLASMTKSFLRTHYAQVGFPVEWEGGREGLCKPNGLKLAYYDTRSNVWTGRTHVRPTFVHHVQLELPLNSPFRQILNHQCFSMEHGGPSSYDIMATQMSCPSGLNPHEYLAFKTLLSGSARRWIQILVELGSTNLNWSSEVTMLLINHLALQCGPQSGQDDTLRLVHSVFRDASFVDKLLCQIQLRLDTLSASSNWRESHLMGTIMAIVLRTYDLAVASGLKIALKALDAILLARDICVRWFRALRTEIQASADLPTARQLQHRALGAALLCRRSFSIHVGQTGGLDAGPLAIYLESAIVIQENIASDIDSLPKPLQQDLAAAMKLSYQLAPLVLSSVLECPEGFMHAVKYFWPEADSMESPALAVRLEAEGWVCCEIDESLGSAHASAQVVHVNFLFGYLLVNGKPVGKLPQESQNSLVIKELFGDQPLSVYQSTVPGMTYTLAHRPNKFAVHVGYENGEEFIIARTKGLQVRLIPRELFFNEEKGVWDLPIPLVLEHFHWLNLATGEVYISPIKSPWVMSWKGWVLNIHKGLCSKKRVDHYGGQHVDTVVDPLSPLFNRVDRILNGIAPKHWLLVTQPSRSEAGLEVSIKQLQLMFFANHNQLLFSPQLNLEIDPDQDAGTWYGLKQKLVCRKVDNPFRRTIIVPLGKLNVARRTCHVTVSIDPDPRFGKFEINDTLGRIDCAAEPALVYMKALLHASTSFLLPDPLTGRTGAEESLAWLSSSICRPWTVLGPEVSILNQIATLTPVSEYYPAGMKVMKTDIWGKNLTTHIQHPLYRTLVDEILAISMELTHFTPPRLDGLVIKHDMPELGDSFLNMRALIRRQLYQRRSLDEIENYGSDVPTQKVYTPRDRVLPSNTAYTRVLEFMNILRTRPLNFDTPANIAATLSRGNNIGGYCDVYEKISLNERLTVDIRQNWGALVQYCRKNQQSQHSLVFLFAPFAFRETVDDGLLKALAAFAVFTELQTIELPPGSSYFDFRPNSMPQLDGVTNLLLPFRKPMPEDERDELFAYLTAKQRRKLKSDSDAYERRAHDDCRFLAKFFLAQWPCPELSISGLPRNDLLVNVSGALEIVQPEWTRLYQNLQLSLHLVQVQEVLDAHRSDYQFNPPAAPDSEGLWPGRMRGDEVPSLSSHLLKKPFLRAFFLSEKRTSPFDWAPLASVPQDDRRRSIRSANRHAVASNAKAQMCVQESGRYIQELHDIVTDLGNSKSLVRKDYARDLLFSLGTFRNLKTPLQLAKPFLYLRDYALPKSEVLRVFSALKASLEGETADMSSHRVDWLRLGGLLPPITTVALLQQLRSGSENSFGRGMHEGIVSLGLAITKLQRDVRLNDCVMAGDTSRFQDEEGNTGHSNWRPADHPDWLLLEIEANWLIRPDQISVARATISPESGTNSVLQMNMGQGKTSCIIPMVAAAMADKQSLVRVIIPKALLLQTAQLLQSRLGGLVNRNVRHVPFSRRTPTDNQNIQLYYDIHRHIRRNGGVMLCLPEHNLSFMLSGKQRLLDNKINEAKPMIKVHGWLQSVCRDILDESDYTLATRTQLIYPSGSQMSVDGHPHRWQVAEAVLSLVDQHLYGLASSYPRSIEVVRRKVGGFPLIYFLRQDVEDELLRRLTVDIIKGSGHILPMYLFDAAERAAIKDFLAIGKRKLRPNTLLRVNNLCPDRPHIKQTAYLLRGLLVNRILIMTLKKRWNVQYGLHPNRDPVAVPFHAKGVPSDQSEWGHPDVAILFTCLVFYYDGVNESQLAQSLARVLKSDDPSTEYEKWVQSTETFPESMKAWNTINVEDTDQVHEIWLAVRYQVVVIDYFLNNFVFPRHAKQFKVKLQSSGWDIPLFSTNSGPKVSKALTTGFSGTNDNRTMLPLTVRQADLPSLSHTNAEVLTYLLHDRSRACEIITDPRGGRATERDLLFMLKRKNIRILIDAGAQILEMDNETLARAWLNIDGSCEAALYFDSANKPWVVSKTGRRTPLLASPYADDLSKCLVYLDEAHTRGTDLMFPIEARGALTVGQGQSKDQTVQAAMRLRQLGRSQSITFFVPPEVHQVIVDLRKMSVSNKIDSHDVISWLLDNTCDGIEQLQPLYYSQGIDFCRRTQAVIDNPDYLDKEDPRARYITAIRQNELQTLQEMYEPKTKTTKAVDFKASHPQVAAFAAELSTRRKGFQDTGRAVHGSALQEVEQEREVAFEVETVRQLKKPPHYEPLTFPGLHKDLEVFARTGRLPTDTYAASHVFRFLSRTGLGRQHRVSPNGNKQSRLFVSTEFERTVRLYTDLGKDNFLRPVSWVIWSAPLETAVVLIPEEAEVVICMMRARQAHVHVHLLSYATPITRNMMLAFNNLTFFSMPPLPTKWSAPEWLRIELGIITGRLYFEWSEYEGLCRTLGVDPSSDDIDEMEEENDDAEGVDPDPDAKAMKNKKFLFDTARGGLFSPRPLTFMQDWLAVRRHGQDFVHTPMGFLTQGKPLHETHPFFGAQHTDDKKMVAEHDPLTSQVAKLRITNGGSHRLGYDGGGYESQDDEMFDAIDDMGANVGSGNYIANEKEVVYESDEYHSFSDDDDEEAE